MDAFIFDALRTPRGHPLGVSGAILVSSLLDSLDECGGRFGMVVGGSGEGAAMIVEREG